MSGPDFDEVINADEESGESNTGVKRASSGKTVHIKGEYGTTTKQSEDGCWRCRKNAAVVVVGRPDGEDTPTLGQVISPCCSDHQEETVEELEEDGYDIKVVEF